MEELTLVFLALVFAHLLADHPLQGQFLATMKGENVILLVSHAGIWTGVVSIAGILVGLDVGLVDVILLFSVHSVADWLKAANKLFYKKFDSLKGGLLIDQLIHIGQLAVFMFMTF